jgi:hypothetical protein
MDDFDPGAFLGEGTERLPALPRLCGGNRPGVMPTLPSLHGEVRMASQYSVATSPSCESINLMGKPCYDIRGSVERDRSHYW